MFRLNVPNDRPFLTNIKIATDYEVGSHELTDGNIRRVPERADSNRLW